MHERDLKELLKLEIENQFKVLKDEKIRCLQEIGYVRPRTRLEQMSADEYMSDKNFANILGLGQVIRKYPELTDEDLRKFISRNKMSFIFLNHLLKVMPDMIATIRDYGEKKVVFNYVRLIQSKKMRNR